MLNAVGLVEFLSISKGVEAADAMVKTADVEIFISSPICPGKYIVLVYGSTAAVESSVKAGINIGGNMVVDEFILANVHSSVFPAITNTVSEFEVKALGMIETFSVASLIIAADAAAKAADVSLIEIRLAVGIGGKAFVTLTGDVAAVKCAVEAGCTIAAEKGLLVNSVVIPSPSKKLIERIG